MGGNCYEEELMRAAYYTLGCKVNQYETNAMQELLEAAGYETVSFEEAADVYIINTCTVTAVADKKSRQMIRRATERKQQEGLVLVAGCFAQRDEAAVLAIEGVDIVIGSSKKGEIVALLAVAHQAKKERQNFVEDIANVRSIETLQISRSGERIRANVKICDGCDNYCSYCIIPYVRGPVRSRHLQDIVEEVERLVANDVKEVVLTGIHASSYGKDLEEGAFLDVLSAIDKIRGLSRIRLSSLEPSLLTDDFCMQASRLKKLCPHFHVSLQSGSDSVLKRMNRRYTTETYAGYIGNLRKHFAQPAIATDIIAGFQGESEEEHQETLAFAKKMQFSSMHIFPYSKRTGTRAASMPGDIPNAVKKKRVAELMALGEEMKVAYQESFIEKECNVLFEHAYDEKNMIGYTERYVPVVAPAEIGEIVTVRCISRDRDVLIGEK